MNTIIGDVLRGNQNGFKAEQGCWDHVFLMR